MAPWFANQSCDPFQPASRPCELGNYVRFAVDVQSVSDIQATIAFAKHKNIRFVIRNTGHDYLGRSTGAGALAVRTHNLKNIDIVDFQSDDYTGKAAKLGAGVQGFEIMAAARDHGLVVVGGECPTVGIAGGYTQGGGHSAISTNFGLSADNTLEWEVVLANGSFVTASRAHNQDLYWALSGGGGSTYGVVVSMTVKAHPDAVVSGAALSFYAADNPTDQFYAGIQAWHEALPALVDAGTMIVYYFTTDFFMVSPLTAYNKTQAEVEEIMAQYIASLEALGVVYTVTYTESAKYYNHMDTYFGPLPFGSLKVSEAQYAGRLIPRSVVANISDTWKSVIQRGVTWIGVAMDVAPFGSPETNSVHPAWRESLIHCVLNTPWNFTAPWEDMLALQDLMTNIVMPEIEAVTPGSGAYVNEADFRQPNFQETFWGSNYDKLRSIKNKYDPENLFYATKGVGSEAWNVFDNGRMCSA